MILSLGSHADHLRPARLWLSAVCRLALAAALAVLLVERAPSAWAQAGGSAPMQRPETEASPEQLLDESLTANPERIAQAKAKAAAPPPQTTDPALLTRFYRERGMAARTAGLTQQAIADLQQAADQARQAPDADRPAILYELALTLTNIGRNLPAIAALKQAIATNPQERRGRLIGWYSLLAALQSYIGNLAAAEESVAECVKQYYAVVNSRRGAGLPEPARIRFHVQALRAEAKLREARGQHAKAEPLLRNAIEELQRVTDQADFAGRLHNQLSRNLLSQGRLAEAENEARLALATAQRVGGAAGLDTGAALVGLALVLIEEGRVGEAETLIRKSMEILRTAGLNATSNTRIPLAAALAVQGRWQESLKEFETLRAAYEASRFPQQFEISVRRNPIYPLAMLKSGRGAEALQRLEQMATNARNRLGDKHQGAAMFIGLYGMALAETGSKEKALAEFQRAVPVLLQRSRASDDGEDTAAGREQRLRLVLESYISVLADRAQSSAEAAIKLEAASEAFKLAEAARGQSVVRALAASSTRAAAGTPELADIARREQDAQLQLGALNGLLANAISARAEDQDAEAIKALRQQIDQLRDERTKIAEEIERKFPDYAGLINPKPASLADARATLKPDEALLAFYVGEGRSYVWAVSAGSVQFHASALGHEALAKQVAALRQSLDPNAQSLDEVPVFDVAAAYRLYQALIQPTEPAWREAKSLVVVPHGPLGQLPLGLLPTATASLEKANLAFAGYAKVPWLIRRVAVSQMPSVVSLLTLRALPPGRADRRPFVGFGDPWFSKAQAEEARLAPPVESAALTTRGVRLKLRSAPRTTDVAAEMSQLPRLPDTAEEVTGVARALKADTAHEVFLGAAASKQTVAGLKLANWRIVMFATHGLVPGDLTGLTQPALALSAPEVTGEAGTGLLTTEDILALKLDADWVILSACNTASGQGAGAEAVSGLGRAFFYAGARALLVSNWPVETTSARAITTDLFRRQAENAGLARAEALRQAMLALIDSPGYLDPGSGKPLFSYAHPIFWSAFSLVGDGGGRWR